MDWLARKKNTSVLIVEDDLVIAKMYMRLLNKFGIAADLSPNGLDAIERHSQRPYPLVICDWMMSGPRGIDLCRMFRDATESYVYFILATSRSDRRDRLSAYEAGVDDFISKPIDQDELVARIRVASRILQFNDLLANRNEELEWASTRLSGMNRSLEAATVRFHEMFSGMPVPCFTFDSAGNIRDWNQACVETFGIEPHEALDRSIADVFRMSQGMNWDLEMVNRILDGEELRNIDWQMTKNTGEQVFLTRANKCF